MWRRGYGDLCPPGTDGQELPSVRTHGTRAACATCPRGTSSETGRAASAANHHNAPEEKHCGMNTVRNTQLARMSYSMVFSTCSQLTSSLYLGFIYKWLQTQTDTAAYMNAMVHTFFLMDALTADTRVTKHKLKQIQKASIDACRVLCANSMNQ